MIKDQTGKTEPPADPLKRYLGEFIDLVIAAAAMAALQSLSMICKPTAAPHCCACQPQQKLKIVAQCRLKLGSLSSSCSSSSSCATYYNYGGRPGSRKGRLSACRAAAQEPDDRGSSSTGEEGGFEVDKALEDVLRNDDSKKMLESLAEKALQDEESRALLKDFAAAAERVAKAKEDLESIDRRERELAEIVSQMISKAVDEETDAASLVTERERAVRAAEEELRAAEIALVTARAGGSVGKWENEDIDEDLERVESGKAAAISGVAGTLASVPFLLTGGDQLGIGSLLSIGGVVISCALFGVTYRYILRRDLGNIQLKTGAAAAFALVRGIGQVDAIQLHVGYPAQGGDEVLLSTLSALEGLFSFGFSALALDYCLTNALLSPFPAKKC